MAIRFRCPLAVLALVAAGACAAQTCSSPIVVTEGLMPVYDTCEASNSLPMIGTINSPQNDVVYSFSLTPAIGGHITVSVADFDGAAFLLPAPCGPETEPVQAAEILPGSSSEFSLTGRPPGTYFLVVTGTPSSPESTCGHHQLEAVTFEVDLIFQDGFYGPSARRVE